MPETDSAEVGQADPDELISCFLKAIPGRRYWRGVRYPQWYLLLLAVLRIQGLLEVTPRVSPQSLALATPAA
jgi:hypothetical protein